MIIDFEHQNSSNCETGTVVNLLNFYGLRLSEPMVFGIGSGLLFAYLPIVKAEKGVPLLGFRLFPGVIKNTVFKKLGVKIETKHYSKKHKDAAMKKLDELLAKGIPVCNRVGMYFIPYMPLEIREHWNMHNFCVIGKEQNEYTVSETLCGIKKISYEDLKKARFSEGKLKPRGEMWWVKKMPSTPPDMNKLIIQGIEKTCNNMLDFYGFPWVAYYGTHGIVKLSKYVRKLDAKLGEGAPIFLAKIIRHLEELNTGGSGYRFIYGAFLFEAANVLNKPKLKDFSIEMNNIGLLWREFSIEGGRKLKKRSDVSYEQLADKLLLIASAEKKFFTDLKKYIKTECKK